MTKAYPIFAAIVFFAVAGCTVFYSDKTPERVNIEPLFSIQLDRPFMRIDKIKAIAPSNHWTKAESGVDYIGFIKNDDAHHIYRSIYFKTFESSDAALEYYETDKTIFTRDMWKLYKEEGTSSNMYFSSYHPVWSAGHGVELPVVIDEAQIEFENLKGNLLISVNYHCYGDDTKRVRKCYGDDGLVRFIIFQGSV